MVFGVHHHGYFDESIPPAKILLPYLAGSEILLYNHHPM